MATPLAAFGPGILICTRTDITPGIAVNVGFANEFSMELAGTTKPLYGQNQFPLVQARATVKATGKIKAAVVSGLAMNNLFYGQTLSTTTNLNYNIGSTFTSSSGSTAVQVGSGATFDADLGVVYAASTISGAQPAGLPLQRVSSGLEGLGKYSISIGSPGLYNFSTADTYSTLTGGVGPMNVKVTFTNSTTTGQSLAVNNVLIGTSPTFQLDYYTNLNQPASKVFAVRCYACIGDKHMMAFKLEDFMLPEWDFSMFADNSGRVYGAYFPEIA